jgi:hypothetical protein
MSSGAFLVTAAVKSTNFDPNKKTAPQSAARPEFREETPTGVWKGQRPLPITTMPTHLQHGKTENRPCHFYCTKSEKLTEP